jgi:Domain of unknown function (DUF4173)
MREKTRLGLWVLGAGLLLGLLGDALLRAEPWGLNVLLWVGALAAASASLVGRAGRARGREGRWLVPCALAFAAGFAWRDSLVLRLLDACVILVLLALAVLRARGGLIRLGGMTDYALAGLVSGLSAAFGPLLLLFSDITWQEIPSAGWSRKAFAVLRGLFIAVPLLIVFGALFIAADAVYEGLVNQTFNFDLDTVASHVLVFVVLAWASAGFLRAMFIGGGGAAGAGRPSAFVVLGLGGAGREEPLPAGPREAGARGTEGGPRLKISLGIVEVGVVLGLLNALFFSFVAVQLRHLFGGASVVLDASGPTYAEYARRGFFELVWVAALVLPLLLAAHWLLRKESPAHERIFRWLAGGLLALLFVIMASAVGRMRLYQSEYGQTELRLYTTAFMGWLAVVFVWFAWTVLRGARERFACGALVSGLLVAAALHVSNPNDHIVRTNAALAGDRRAFDAAYAQSLGADAVPALLEALPELSPRERAFLSLGMLEWAGRGGDDWRSWNWSRHAARRAIRGREESLREWARQGADELSPTDEPSPAPVLTPVAVPQLRAASGE